MALDLPAAERIAAEYLGTTEPLTCLGWGISGFVFLSPDLRTAVKVHRNAESFANELAAYRLLDRLRIFRLHGLTIPRLRDSRSELSLIRLDFVRPPFLLHLAGVTFSPPD